MPKSNNANSFRCAHLVDRAFGGKAKICDTNMAVIVEHEIRGLNVSMDDIVFMQVTDSQNDFGGIELRDWLRHCFVLSLQHNIIQKESVV
jgi:hypothetical protein